VVVRTLDTYEGPNEKGAGVATGALISRPWLGSLDEAGWL